MTTDEGEMFFLEYWRFEGEGGDVVDELLKRGISNNETPDGHLDGFNGSMLQSHKPPLLQHESHEVSQRPLLARYFSPQRAQLYPRDFICPTGTSDCSYINQPNSCCENGLTCNIVPNTGLGVVGCCAGSSCSGQVASCPDSYTSCPSSQGGGCCIPGYVCSGVGCVLSSTATVVVIQTVAVSLSPSTSTIVSTTVISTPTSTSTPTTTSVTSTSTTTVIQSRASTPIALTCSPGFQSCPASFGGGCCTSGRLCGTGVECPAASTSPSTSISPASITVSAPIRPTSIAGLTTTITPSICPTGFYQCSAYYNGGNCCQIGRDCASTSCPPRASSTALLSNGITVVNAPTAGATATGPNAAGVQVGSCATGWFLCGSQAGGGCCPSGYSCAAGECLAGPGASETGAAASVAQEAASEGAGVGRLSCRDVSWVAVVVGALVFWMW
ncbi:hypothetical protein MMC26_003253 [Xylographa opegraphella]|nr:hypothetical protein [Xylographa opegraphella]